MTNGTYDYIVVGGGSAGCVLASRLSENPSIRVLLLEAGGSNRHLWSHVPLGVGKVLTTSRLLWAAETEPESELHGTRMDWPSGKMIGGSSSINGMVFVRGHPTKYNAWRDTGCSGWGYEDLLPFFRRLEDCPFGDLATRGRGGPIGVTEVAGDQITDSFIAACQQAGYPRITDYNSDPSEGAAPLQLSVRNGRRSSTATGYLYPALARPNLQVITGATALRVLIAGQRAIGVEYYAGGDLRQAQAEGEVLLCAGAIRSPQILELSGIGNEKILQQQGIKLIHHLPGVGENLQDHLMVRIAFQCTVPRTVNDLFRNPLYLLREAARYLLFRHGLFATPALTALAYLRSHPEAPYPDIRMQLGLMSGTSRLSVSQKTGLDRFSGFHLGVYDLYPDSRGSLHIVSADPTTSPRIQANYLSHPKDQAVSIASLKLIRHIASQPALKSLIVRESRPGPEIASDEDLLDYVRRTGHTCWHPVGTCRMGLGPDAVVDPELCVYGVSGLRVVDASVMPFLVASNTNVPTVAIAEKAAALITDDKSRRAEAITIDGARLQPKQLGRCIAE
ncbi:GMC family oxidoreductase N-terminal domain-containing protein [Acidiphilium sp. AL]|uniref:GMC family oxidoreductase n=1 Tax=Acidiphilium sp. AL TaxID=2871704 RepID=UPI0021CB2F35|nr:GMC family oxidoreductase N-terminal domain-containing protein [Acidiphilium sp. AL]MCU4161983.1 GMC family oxidoreductase N-terminal domain-containing protein [Acidiphilium sp. AL]